MSIEIHVDNGYPSIFLTIQNYLNTNTRQIITTQITTEMRSLQLHNALHATKYLTSSLIW